MYIIMDMPFLSIADAPDFGSIGMYFVGSKELGYMEQENKRYRKYALLSSDINKLNNITNALDGSEALAVDTGDIYILHNNTWTKQSSTNSDIKEYIDAALENITGINFQIVNELPSSGESGTIYFLSTQNNENGNIYEEYVWVNNNFERVGSQAIGEATTTNAGLLSASDKIKLNNLDTTYLKNSDVVVTSFSNYNSLSQKTAKYYLIVEE